jgi:hypothetical protein
MALRLCPSGLWLLCLRSSRFRLVCSGTRGNGKRIVFRVRASRRQQRTRFRPHCCVAGVHARATLAFCSASLSLSARDLLVMGRIIMRSLWGAAAKTSSPSGNGTAFPPSASQILESGGCDSADPTTFGERTLPRVRKKTIGCLGAIASTGVVAASHILRRVPSSAILAASPSVPDCKSQRYMTSGHDHARLQMA